MRRKNELGTMLAAGLVVPVLIVLLIWVVTAIVS